MYSLICIPHFLKIKIFLFRIQLKIIEKYIERYWLKKRHFTQQTESCIVSQLFIDDLTAHSTTFTASLQKFSSCLNGHRALRVMRSPLFLINSRLHYDPAKIQLVQCPVCPPLSGMIYTTDTLDRETKDSYWLTVYASDRGVVPQFTTIEVFIEVEDVNDNAPLTSEPLYRCSVPENSPRDVSVVQIQAQDPDVSPTNTDWLNFRIISGNPQNFFTINPRTGT